MNRGNVVSVRFIPPGKVGGSPFIYIKKYLICVSMLQCLALPLPLASPNPPSTHLLTNITIHKVFMLHSSSNSLIPPKKMQFKYQLMAFLLPVTSLV